MPKVRGLLAVTLFFTVGMLATFATTQDNDGLQQPPATEHMRGHGFDPAKRTEMLTKRLGLTSDQQPKVLDALKSEQSQMESLHSDSSLSQEDRHMKMMDIHKSTNDQVRAILNPDQQKKWDEMQNRHEQWQGHHHEGQAPAQPDSSNQNN
jgi:periplasmic protein CpxP/Spy